MLEVKSFINNLLNSNKFNFESHAIELFRWQAVYNKTYKSYLSHLGVEVNLINKIEEIPFLPISFFKNHNIQTNDWEPQKVFESSGTSGSQTSKHFINDLNFYHTYALSLFEKQFGGIKNTHILALLPSYLERDNSSLVSMVQYFIETSTSSYSGFYLDNYDELVETLLALKEDENEVILFGVTFALLELAEKYKLDLSHVTLIETGGMKGRREEVTRNELYEILNTSLHFGHIYSEYGMTELLSQAYGENAYFQLPATMQVFIREVNDPFSLALTGKTGGVNVIDLANIHTCAFIETQDLGRINANGTFEVLGRFDNSDLRGCNLLVS